MSGNFGNYDNDGYGNNGGYGGRSYNVSFYDKFNKLLVTYYNVVEISYASFFGQSATVTDLMHHTFPQTNTKFHIIGETYSHDANYWIGEVKVEISKDSDRGKTYEKAGDPFKSNMNNNGINNNPLGGFLGGNNSIGGLLGGNTPFDNIFGGNNGNNNNNNGNGGGFGGFGGFGGLF